MKLPSSAGSDRLSAETIPVVSDQSRPKGLPMANTFCPTLSSALVPFGLFYEGLKRLDASRAGIVALLEPIVAIGSAALWLGEGLSWSQGAGAALILLGVGIVARTEP